MTNPNQQTKAVALLALGTAATTAAAGATLWRKTRPPRLPVSALDNPPAGAVATAVITGASSGIGATYARRLAADDFNLLLVARRGDRLQTLADELCRSHGITAESFTADLSRSEHVQRLADRLQRVDHLVLLVNNAGFGTIGHLVDVDLQPQIDMVNLHVMAPMHLSKAVLPGMIARQRGAIINVSSIAAFFHAPYNANYGATKAYLNSFSQTLQAELDAAGVGDRVRVQALCPGWTYSEFHDTAEFDSFDRNSVPGYLWQTADQVVTESLAALHRAQVIVVPGWRNRLIIATANRGLGTTLLRTFRKIAQRR